MQAVISLPSNHLGSSVAWRSARSLQLLTLFVSIRKTKVNYLQVFFIVEQNILRFDIPMNEVPVVDVFDPADHLVDEHEHRFEGELAEGVLEE